MADAAPSIREETGPIELRDGLVKTELKRAAVWVGLVAALFLAWTLAQPLLLILGGVVFAAMLDGGTRLLGRVLPIGRGWRLAIVSLVAFGFLLGTFAFAGYQLAAQAATLRDVLTEQSERVFSIGSQLGLVPEGSGISTFSQSIMGSLGRLTSAVGTAVGAITSLVLMIVIGIFVAVEPRIYDRGMAWLLPLRSRQTFYRTTHRMAHTLRMLMAGRLLGMAVEGVFTWLLLLLAGVPFAAILGLLTGILAFIPNIGAIVSGVLIVAAGFSVGQTEGFYAIGVYAAVQIIDGYVIVPYVAKKTVDLSPATVLGAQLIFGALFGILGLALADPILAMMKEGLSESADENEDKLGDELAPEKDALLAAEHAAPGG